MATLGRRLAIAAGLLALAACGDASKPATTSAGSTTTQVGVEDTAPSSTSATSTTSEPRPPRIDASVLFRTGQGEPPAPTAIEYAGNTVRRSRSVAGSVAEVNAALVEDA